MNEDNSLVKSDQCLSLFLMATAAITGIEVLILGPVLFFFNFQFHKKNSVPEDKSMVKSDQWLRLFSSRRQPPLLVSLKRLVIASWDQTV